MALYNDVQPYFAGQKRCYYFEDAVSKAAQFAPHADGVYPQELIECRRPNEPEEVKEYRCKIWKPKTKPSFTKILLSLSKIRRSSDWSIKYPQEQFSKVRDGETLEQYCEKKYPFFGSITNWTFGILLKKQLTDPNAVIFVRPLNEEVAENEYLQPYAWIFDSIHVQEYTEGVQAILNDVTGTVYNIRRGRGYEQRVGKAYWVITTNAIERWEQRTEKEEYEKAWEYIHSLGVLPVFKLRGIISAAEGSDFLYESRIAGILPDLDEALREYSDLQAAKVLHIFPERWEYTQNECTNCKGTGRRRNPAWYDGCAAEVLAQINCDTCGGRGYVATGPYSKMLIRPTNTIEGTGTPPMPPAGFIEKDVEIVKVMEASVKQHIYDALSAINFQFLEQTPLNQSGTAKEVDKEELNNTVHAIAEDLIWVMDQVYKFTAYYRYRAQYPLTEIDAMLPSIAVPEHYDLLSSQFMQQELDTAKKAKINPILTGNMEVEYAGKRFLEDPEIKDRLELVLKLDPLQNVSVDEKMAMLASRTITKETAIISDNIQEFVQRALDEDNSFAAHTLKEQKRVMKQYAQEQIASADTGIVLADDAQDADSDVIGKIPLAIQQLSLAAARATEAGDAALSATIKNQINELLAQLQDG